MLCKQSLNLFEEDFDNDQIIITANRRLANSLWQTYDEKQISLGKQAWIKPKILPLTDWIESQWQTFNTDQRLLTHFQELQLWKGIIQKSEFPLLNLTSTAKQAQSAWQNLHLWDIPFESIENNMNEEVFHFSQWAKFFKQQCDQYRVITFSELPKKLLLGAFDLQDHLPKKFILCGFEEIAPIYEKLFSAFENRCPFVMNNPNQIASSIHRLGLVNETKEIETMARWAKEKIETDSKRKIACIIPELHRLRSQVETIFTDLLHPEKTVLGISNEAPLFNISAGQPLIQYEIIQHVYLALQLMRGEMDIHQAHHLFQSPYFIHHEMDKSIGAFLEIELRYYPENHLPLQALFKPLEKWVPHFSQTTWLRRWQAICQLIKNLPPKALPSEWSDYFTQWLDTLGWPGFRTLNSHEYQLVKRLEKLLLEFSSLDFLGNFTLSKALTSFQQLITDTIFQPQSKKPPIQILGVLEAIGLSFDEVWLMGLHDGAWPPPAKPNPFIPLSLQIQHRMPHANAHRELEYTKQLTSRLFASADNIIISYPLQEEDRELRPSQLIISIKEITEETLALKPYESYLKQIYLSSKKEWIKDDIAPAVKNDEYLWGGSNVIRAQSACPFRAFAQYRLNAKRLETPVFGLSPSQRGILLHKALEIIWRDIQNHQALISIDQSALLNKIEKMASVVVDDFFESNVYFPSQKILMIEKKRLVFLISKWLEIEKKRSPFTVLKREFKYQIHINQLPLSIQIDRIDQTQDGNYLIIDYKTSNASISDWFGDRPKDPQLPLYCVMTNPDNVHYFGISFAVIRANKMEFRGVMQEFKNHSIPGVIPLNKLTKTTSINNWYDIKQHWMEVINRLAKEFCEGIAKVEPQDNSTCNYCHLHSLCRIYENEK